MAEQLVYFIQGPPDGPVKIGVAQDPERRLRELQTAQAEPLRLIRTVSGGAVLERRLHAALAASRIRGEWFSPTDEVRRVIADDDALAALAQADVPAGPFTLPNLLPDDPRLVELRALGDRRRAALQAAADALREAVPLILALHEAGEKKRVIAELACISRPHLDKVLDAG